MSIFGVQTKYSIQMNSRNNNVKVIRKNIVANRPKYAIYLDSEEVGTLEMKNSSKVVESNKYPINLIISLIYLM